MKEQKWVVMKDREWVKGLIGQGREKTRGGCKRVLWVPRGRKR